MPRPVPFIFCHYEAAIEGEVLNASGLLQALTEIQGQFLPHGAKAAREGENTVVVMKPFAVKVDEEDVVTWEVGHRPGHRMVTDYDSTTQEIRRQLQQDSHILHTTVVALPRLGVMAVSDRVNALSMGALPALSRTRSVFKRIPKGAFKHAFLTSGELGALIGKLALTEYQYTVRRINPTPPSVLAAALDESMKLEGIGINRGVAKPMPGDTMKANGAFIEATTDLAGAGYGVLGFKGHTDGGHLAQVKKPPFSLDKNENKRQQEREAPLRVVFEIGDNEKDSDLLASVVRELVRFYQPNDPSDIPRDAA